VNATARAQRALTEFISNPAFPCLGAKGALRQGGCLLQLYGALGSGTEVTRLAHDLAAFCDSVDGNPGLTAFAAAFPDAPPTTEIDFETAMWRELQALHEHDRFADEWAPDSSDDPSSDDFAFSFARRSFFIIGLHPASSRIARRFQMPVLVFNPRSQFDQLRADGRFEPLKTAIRRRDMELQGNTNPSLADFGERSEARQYSGRQTEAEWSCPFHRKTG
jgi:FPC/CPF motif-containing protein YcgG